MSNNENKLVREMLVRGYAEAAGARLAELPFERQAEAAGHARQVIAALLAEPQSQVVFSENGFRVKQDGVVRIRVGKLPEDEATPKLDPKALHKAWYDVRKGLPRDVVKDFNRSVRRALNLPGAAVLGGWAFGQATQAQLSAAKRHIDRYAKYYSQSGDKVNAVRKVWGQYETVSDSISGSAYSRFIKDVRQALGKGYTTQIREGDFNNLTVSQLMDLSRVIESYRGL